MEHLLTKAANDLSIRSQVEDTLTSILHDVETAHTLQQSLNAHNVLHDLQEKYAALQLRYEERETVWEMERREKEQLGVALLEEIVKLSARGVREENERRALEMQLQRLMVDRQKDSAAQDEVASEAAAAPSVSSQLQKIADNTNEVAVEQSEETTSEAVEPVKHSPNQNDIINLHELNETILMAIFAFSNPMDIMNFAQINKAMFNRIDTLFGMGSSVVNSEAQISATSAADLPNTRPPLPPTPSVPVIQSSASVASVNSQSSGTAPPKTSPKLFAMSSPSIPSIVGPSSGSSWLPRFGAIDTTPAVSTAQSITASNPPTHTRTPSSGSLGSTPDPEIKLNAAMANSMASKLTPAELSVILRMREKLQKCEADAARWRQEKEDAVANLESVEAVKEFLVTRVRDTENIVEKQKEEMKEVQRKALADQEVIVFLDERVKKLEHEMGDIKTSEISAKQEAADVVAKHEKKVRVLSDMLRFEREQMSTNEKEWKNTKKLLVKEVKSCRSHIVTLEAELEGLKRQNEQLTKGMRVMSPPKKGLKSYR